MQSYFEQTHTCFEQMQTKSVLTPELRAKLREENFKTLRELPLFGYAAGGPVDFRHPSIADLQAMPKDKLIKAVGFKWKKNS